jgi:EAL domain-containing protein (putative c-di-GMP-specific phosphodiesterase class I)
MLEKHRLRFLVAVAVTNGFVTVVGPAIVLFRPGGPSAQVGDLIYLMAAIALGLTPLQVVAGWFALRPLLREQSEGGRRLRRIDEVIESRLLDIAFQPIVDLPSGRVAGVEALARFIGDPPQPPDRWFADADTVGRGLRLELLAVETALQRARLLPDHLYIAINVAPETLASPQLLPVLLDTDIPAYRIVVEVTEHATVLDYPTLREAREQLRHHGVRLAVDDAGSGYASFRHIVGLAPDIIKLDRSLVARIDSDRATQALVEAVTGFALQSDAIVVGEGVETMAEMQMLRTLGVCTVQGFYLGRPTTCVDDWQTWDLTSVESQNPSTARDD